MPGNLTTLLERNRNWAREVETVEPGFFESLRGQQTPEYLWIGCADSRVPANELVGLRPGELFVHRNVANVVSPSDLNCLSCIQYAVDVLKVNHIMVVGHSGCGGVHAALNGVRIGVADNWILHVRDAIERHAARLGNIADARRIDAACELNVLEQARNVCQTTVIRDAWERGQLLTVHGWVYALHNGVIHSIGFDISNAEMLESNYSASLSRILARHSGNDNADDDAQSDRTLRD
ncbi:MULTISPECIES: carbonate dehydratase [Paraburkholderia]|uniref:carbonate dehydratase n=1 Tax=Paraburkholderia TaxID=1822464 RepID=UPI000AC405A4|nr:MULTISPECIES: carbonate dehydratase [Paraburkholderia]MBK5153492.1 carbonate dehydratase [Burkholderia sp. R-69608]MBK5185579.1 carbonate dehydratase [Burkholderia sp. R-69749]CAE6881150.1 Carbonic anhydrase 2 [Paraburkholderia domus]CAE6972314.1 Carbonic anhydrase 2 [Paraburkholderia nemoris]